jgi:hypothetical protein
MTVTKKYKLERFDALQRKHDLLERYFWDSRRGVMPNAKARIRTKDGDVLLFSLYRTAASHGGYIVIEYDLTPGQSGTSSIHYWDQWQDETNRLTDYGSEYVLAVKQAAETLRRALSVTESVAASM